MLARLQNCKEHGTQSGARSGSRVVRRRPPTSSTPDPGWRATSLREGGCSRRRPSHSPTPKMPKLSVKGDSLRYSNSRHPEDRVPRSTKPHRQAPSHPLRRTSRARSSAALPPQSTDRWPVNHRPAVPAHSKRAPEPYVPDRHAAVGPHRRGHEGPDGRECACLAG
jgi:hypothetical protein